MDFPVFKEFIYRLGFISDNQAIQENDKENLTIVYELWRNLGGELRSHVTLNNVRMFLLAIMGAFAEPVL